MASWCMQICRALAIQSGQSSQTFSHQSISDFSNCRAFYWNESCLEHPSCNAYSLKCIPHTLISRSRHVEIENETPVVRNPEVTVKHQPGSTATAIYEPRCGTRMHVCCFFLYFTAIGIRGGMLKLISCISESVEQLDRGLNQVGALPLLLGFLPPEPCFRFQHGGSVKSAYRACVLQFIFTEMHTS